MTGRTYQCTMSSNSMQWSAWLNLIRKLNYFTQKPEGWIDLVTGEWPKACHCQARLSQTHWHPCHQSQWNWAWPLGQGEAWHVVLQVVWVVRVLERTGHCCGQCQVRLRETKLAPVVSMVRRTGQSRAHWTVTRGWQWHCWHRGHGWVPGRRVRSQVVMAQVGIWSQIQDPEHK